MKYICDDDISSIGKKKIDSIYHQHIQLGHATRFIAFVLSICFFFGVYFLDSLLLSFIFFHSSVVESNSYTSWTHKTFPWCVLYSPYLSHTLILSLSLSLSLIFHLNDIGFCIRTCTHVSTIHFVYYRFQIIF